MQYIPALEQLIAQLAEELDRLPWHHKTSRVKTLLADPLVQRLREKARPTDGRQAG